MKSLCLLVLLVTAVLCDDKSRQHAIGNRDRFRTNISRISKKSIGDTSRSSGESKYSTKAEVNQSHKQYYHGPVPPPSPPPAAPPQELGNQYADYAELQSHESFKYVPSATRLAQQQPQHYTSDGHGSFQNVEAGLHQYSQPHQHQMHQQEISVGNQLQSVRQKAATQKYVDPGEDRGIIYIDIPTSQLLAYHQNYATKQPGNSVGEQQITIPVYMPMPVQKYLYATMKDTPQRDYQTAYQKQTQVIYPEDPTNPRPTHVPPVSAQTVAPSHQPYAAEPTYASVASQQPKYQYYVTSQQHLQQPADYAAHQQQPSNNHNPVAHVDIYNVPGITYINDNSLYDQQATQQYSNSQMSHRYNDATAVAERLMAQILQQLGVPYVEEFLEQNLKGQEHDYSSPRQQPQKFHGNPEINHLVPVSAENDGFLSKPVHSPLIQKPKTLLDSYVPSHVIAAQDSERYTERPIKLEGGFLPSKINFIHSYKKRQSD